jgi:Uncharacterized conserved protein
MKRDYRLYVEDILDCINKVEIFVEGMNFQQFVQDDKTASAVIRKLEIIGEASKNIPDSIKQQYSQIPWKEMARMRDKIIHHYFDIDYEAVWKILKEELPQVKPHIIEILDQGKSQN